MNVAKTNTIGERTAMVIIALLGIVDALVILGSFTLVDSNYRADFLFSDFCYWLEGRG